jgi:hypothetical protein
LTIVRCEIPTNDRLGLQALLLSNNFLIRAPGMVRVSFTPSSSHGALISKVIEL